MNDVFIGIKQEQLQKGHAYVFVYDGDALRPMDVSGLLVPNDADNPVMQTAFQRESTQKYFPIDKIAEGIEKINCQK